MGDGGTVTGWLAVLRAGHADPAAERLWAAYHRRLVGLARARLGGRPAGPVGADDVALAAFDSFVRAAAGGRFPRLADRHDLWQVLLALTARKAADAVQAEARAKRGGGRVVAASAAGGGIEAVAAGPTPAETAEFADAVADRLGRLADPVLAAVAVRRLEGYTVEEIAAELGVAVATVGRKLKRIRDIWADDAG